MPLPPPQPQFPGPHVPLALGGWELTGSTDVEPMLPGFPRRMEDLMILARPLAWDVDGDGELEVLMGSGGYLLHAFHRDGSEARGFPKFTGGWIFSAPAGGDLDGDGRPEIVAVTREGYLFAWETEVGVATAHDVPSEGAQVPKSVSMRQHGSMGFVSVLLTSALFALGLPVVLL